MALETILKIIGRNVAKNRKSRHLTQRVAADQAGISYRYFQRIEAGTVNITLSTLYRLSQLLKVSVCDILPCEPQPAEARVSVAVSK